MKIPVNDTDALCLDGSPYFYYISVGSSNRFYIYHQGGGWCSDLSDCLQRSKSPLGSSSTWGPTMGFDNDMSRDPKVNSLMYDWNFVYLPYCDGGSFTGNISSSSPLLYFHGLQIREAVVNSLRANYGLNSATDIVIGGCSAGGLAAYLHVDWYSQKQPSATTRGLIDSGFFLDGNYSRDGVPDYEARMNNIYNFMNSKASIKSTCNEKLGYKCLFAYHMIPYITSPIFILNSAYDATMADGACGYSGINFNWNDAATVNGCANYIRSLMKSLVVPPSAVFLDSCKHHCGEWNSIMISGQTSSSAFKIWYTMGDNSLPNHGYMDQNQPYPCDSCCSV